MSRTLILVGLLLVAVGLTRIWWPGLLNWFGQLPGDLRIQTQSSEIFIPLTSALLISLVISACLSWMLGR